MGCFAEVERVFARHRLGPVRTVVPLAGGRLNVALRVNGHFVLRYREGALATGSLRREAALLPRLAGRVPAPELVASGLDENLGEYLIQSWMPGQSLLRAWLRNPDVATREWWIRQWAAAIRSLHEERFPGPGPLAEGGLKPFPSWRAYIESRIRRRIDQLMRVPAVDRQLVLAAERYLRRHAPALEDGPFCLIHRDLHFGNALVEGPQLTAILDFELAESGPPDYELDTIYRFLRYPAEFASIEDASRVTPARFASVWIRLKRGYPELFAARHLRQRLSLYALDHDLSRLLQAHGGGRTPAPWSPDSAAVTEAACRRIGEILSGRYGPE